MTIANWLTLGAALIAASAAVVNVVLTGRTTRRVELEKWRRQDEAAVAARVMVCMRELDEAWRKQAQVMDDAPSGDWSRFADVVSERERALRLAVSELDFVASKKTYERTDALIEAAEVVAHGLRGGGPENKMGQYFMRSGHVRRELTALVDAVRSDLGLEKLEIQPEG